MPQRAPAAPRHEIGGYREFAPPPALAAAAEAVWIHRSTAAGTHLVLPDPALNLAFRCRRLPGGAADEPRLTVIGPKTRPYPFHFRAGEEIAAVKVKLEWARALLHLAPGEHLDREDELTPADVRLPSRLLDCLAAAPSADTAAALLASALAGIMPAAGPRAPAASARALDLVRQATGRVSVEMVADRMRVLAPPAAPRRAPRGGDLAQGLRPDHPPQRRDGRGRSRRATRLGPSRRGLRASATSPTWCASAARSPASRPDGSTASAAPRPKRPIAAEPGRDIVGHARLPFDAPSACCSRRSPAAAARAQAQRRRRATRARGRRRLRHHPRRRHRPVAPRQHRRRRHARRRARGRRHLPPLARRGRTSR